MMFNPVEETKHVSLILRSDSDQALGQNELPHQSRPQRCRKVDCAGSSWNASAASEPAETTNVIVSSPACVTKGKNSHTEERTRHPKRIFIAFFFFFTWKLAIFIYQPGNQTFRLSLTRTKRPGYFCSEHCELQSLSAGKRRASSKPAVYKQRYRAKAQNTSTTVPSPRRHRWQVRAEVSNPEISREKTPITGLHTSPTFYKRGAWMISPGQVPLAETPGQAPLPVPTSSCFAQTPLGPALRCSAQHLPAAPSSFQPHFAYWKTLR